MTDDLQTAPDVNADPEAASRWMVSWIVDEAWKITSPRQLVAETCARLRAVGIPIEVFNAFILTLHPEYFGVVHSWRRSTSEVTTNFGNRSLRDSDLIRLSPLQQIFGGAWGVRWHIESRGAHDLYPVINEYRDEGATDYVAMRLPFQDGSPQSITFTTSRPGGFTLPELKLVDGLLFYLAVLTEVQSTNYLANVLLDTYVGHQAGKQVLHGDISRGSGSTIEAVILMTDLMGFSALSDSLPRDDLINHLNRYFDAVGKPVLERRGEILKFIGDAVLAIFPITETETARVQCGTALDAVVEANALARADDGDHPIRFGTALHVGEVMYGNIGTPGRLDFTVIGPAVNLTSRLESLTRPLGEDVLLSREFVDASGTNAQSLGSHEIKGIARPIEVFRPLAAHESQG